MFCSDFSRMPVSGIADLNVELWTAMLQTLLSEISGFLFAHLAVGSGFSCHDERRISLDLPSAQ